ncbi:hypothetical protein HCN44_001792 [Aphidius gifuensis]|uniref:dynamin GTPase n=1 Tax=Aphidius gifuensis TaxID=684658 RepID=A0A835CKF6_APHGI|nr:hypothetical protein HCN44_001792 [Aphidius gifuensis]
MNTNYEEFDSFKRIFQLLINKESSKSSFKRLILKLKTEAFGEETCAQQDTSEFLITIFKNYSKNKNCKKMIKDLFCGEYNECRKCTNENCKKFCSKEPFFINYLNIQTNTTVKKLMSKNYKNEKQNCINCGQNNSCTIKKVNTILPPYMIFNLNFFVHDKKLNTFKLINNGTFEIDEEIKLPIEIPSKSETKLTDDKVRKSVGSQIYIIYAIIIHDGNTLNSGHYYTYCKDKNTNIWYCFNDNIVTQIKFEDIKTNPSKTLKEKERHSTVQIGLKTAIGINTFNLNNMEKKDYDEKLELYNIIIDDVTRLAKLARDASILYEYCINHPNKWLLNYIANSDKEPRVNDIFNRLRADVRVNKDIDENIIRLLADYENDRPKNVKIPMLHNIDGCSRPFEEMMTQFETNLKVNLNEHGPKRVQKYFYSLKIKTKDGKEENKYTKDEIKKLLDDLFIYNIHPKEELFKEFKDLDFSLFYRKIKWWKFLPFFHKLQGILKNFILIPTFQCNLKHIRYSNTGLKKLASRLYNLKGTKVAETYNNNNNNIKELWKKMFPHIPHFENFDCSMTTNAVYACFLYKKKQKINDDDDDDDDDYDYYYDDKKDEYIVKPEKINNIKEKAKNCEQVVTADPGFRNPLAGITTRGKDCIKNFGDKEHGKPYCLKLSTYRRKTGTFKRQKKLKKITDKVDKAVNELLLKDRYKNLNTKDPTNYIQTMQWRTECTDIMSPVYTQLRVAKLSWDKIMMTRSIIDTTVNKMAWGIGKKNKKLIKNQKKQIEKKIKLLETTNTSKKNNDKNKKQDKKNDEKIVNNNNNNNNVDDDKNKKQDKNDKNKNKKTNHEQKKENKKNKLKEESDKRQNKLTDRQKYQRDRQRRKEQAKKVIRKQEKKEKLKQKYKNILSNINDHFEKKKIQFKNEPNKDKKNKIFNGNFRFYHKRKKLNGKTLFLMGSTKMSNRIRGYVFAPLNIFAKTLKKHKNIIFFNVDEYMTTQNCANCNEKCHNCSVYIDNKKKKRKTIMANNESMEKLIPFMNQIQDIFTKHAVSVKFDLPQIVVIGGQSAGKSSVLENFVGKDFLPRGNGIVTRRPLILQLITNKYSDEEYAEFEHTKTKKFRINEVCKEIENETDKSTVGDKGINPKPITLKIYSPTVLNLTLVDLPGLTKVPVHGQPADIAVQIRKMVFEYINKENALILAVTPANIDLATSDALELTKIVDPNGIRTIGVITKLDMMGEGTDARAVLENKLYPLSRGYVGVINRNQSDIDKKKSIADAIESEKKFFNTHPAYKFFSDRLGIHCLQRILNEQLTNHIRDTLPALRNELDAELSNIIKYLGENDYQLDDSASKIESLSGMHRVVLDLFNNEIGFYESDKVSNTPNGGSKINQLMHKFLPISIANATLADGDLRKEIMETIQNVRGARKGIFLPDKAFENVAKAQISKLKEPSIKCVSLVVKQLTNILLDCTKHMSAYPKLRAETENILISHLKDCEKKCKENLDTSIKIQLSYLNTENSDFVNFKKAEETVVNQNKPPLIQVKLIAYN